MNMKLKFSIIPGLLSAVILSSCLKDTPYMDVSNTAPIIEFGTSPANGSYGPFTYNGDTTASPAIDTAVALVIASPQVLSKAVTVTIKVDTSQISAYNSANDSNYVALPASYYSIGSTTITIPAGYRVGRISVKLNFPQFPATHRYALPLSITDGGGLLISGNASTFMWLFQR